MRLLIPVAVMLLLVSALSAQRQTVAPGDMQAVELIDGAQPIQMKYTIASRRSHTGIATGKQYFVFEGAKAAVRTTNRTPVFQFETDPRFDETVYLFKFDIHSASREIRVAKGSGGLAELAIPKDHIISTTLEQIGNGADSTKRYRLRPTGSLRPGEYCLGRNSSSCFDFGVD